MYQSEILGCVIVVLIIIIIIYLSKRQQEQNKFIEGIWTGDAEFLKKSDLKQMILFISPNNKNKIQSNASLIMTDKNGDTITNQVVNIKRSLFSNNCNVKYEDESFTSIPTSVKMDVDINKGTMMLYDNTKVYGFLIKNNEASIIANETYIKE
jgi:hypothetical protein